MASVDVGGHIIAVPFPGRGHINPMINLCNLLADRGGGRLRITLVVTEEWRGLLSSDPLPQNLQLRSIPDVLPSETTRDANYGGFLEAVLTKMEAPLERLLDALERPVAGILADTFLPWAVSVGCRRKIKVFSLYTMSAAVFTVHYHLDLLRSKLKLPVDLSERGDELVEYIPGIESMRLGDLPSLCLLDSVTSLIPEAFSWVIKAQCVLLNSYDELEPSVIDFLRLKVPVPIYPISPSIPCITAEDKSHQSIPFKHELSYFTWLDSQSPSSVLYISLGSFISVPRLQIHEIAMALQATGLRFLWVLRGSSSDIGFANGDTGLVVPWCQQLKVLCHPAVGGFLTHCGWNSTMESVCAGVPMLAFPLAFDQFMNAKLVVDDWKIGVRLRRQTLKANWVSREDKNVVSREEISRCLGMVMDVDGDEGRELRRRAKDLQRNCHEALGEGGSSSVNLDAFIRDMVGLGN